MKQNVSISHKFVTKSKLANDKLPLYLRITVNGKRTEISLKRIISENLWNTKTEKAIGKSNEAQIINKFIDKKRAYFYECLEQLEKANQLISPSVIKNKFLGKDESNKSLMELIEYHNVQLKDTIRWGTLKNYFTTQRYIKEFLKANLNTSDIYLTQLSYKFVIEFELFLKKYQPKDHHNPMGNNTVMKHIERLRKMINLSVKLEWLDKDPFIKFQAKFEKKERAFLTPEELQSIELKEFCFERLQIVKDLFVFSCYTGLSYVDVMDLTEDNIVLGIDGKHWIHTGRRKTGLSVKIPILGTPLGIIKKYENHRKLTNTASLLPKITNQKLNSYLKEIADICEIHKNLTFHVARHTFATTVTLSNGVPIETVSKLLGHTKLATTQIYARVVEKKVSEDMTILSEKLKFNSSQPIKKDIST